jgi:hypothetical protein
MWTEGKLQRNLRNKNLKLIQQWEQSWPHESHSWSVRQSSPFKTNIAMMSCHDTMHWLWSALNSGV